MISTAPSPTSARRSASIPISISPIYHRGLAYRDKRDYDRAINDFSQAIRLDGRNAAAFDNRGLAYRMKGDLERALADFDQAVRIDPEVVGRA